MILKDICELIVDCPHSTAYDEGAGYPLIRTPNIGKGRLLLDNVHRVSEKVYIKRNKRATPQSQDLILAREAPAGNVAIIQKGEKVCLGQRTVLIRPDQGKVNPSYLTYYLLAPEQQYKLTGTANGSTVAHVNIPVIRDLPITLPERNKQNKIADILSSYDDLIENNQKQIKLLEEAAQRLYKEWFVDLRFPGHEKTPIVDGVPEGWKRCTIGQCLELYIGGGWGRETPTGKYLYRGRVIRGTDIDDIKAGQFHDIPCRFHTENDINKRALKSNDIVFELSNGNIDNIGRSLLINSLILERCGQNTICASFCKLLRPLDVIHAHILYLEIQYMQTSGEMNLYKKNGANGINNFAFEDFLAHELLLPADKSILEVFDFIMQKIGLIRQQVTLLIEARDRLLPKLMCGEVQV